jgi:N-acetylglutamate synthase-like GNAT family acetyltransferase
MAESDGLLSGTGTIIGTSIRRVFINPEYQHHGIGKIIANKLERKAKANGMAKLDLSASLKSRRFWEAMGFVATREFALPVANGQNLLFYEMTKTL